MQILSCAKLSVTRRRPSAGTGNKKGGKMEIKGGLFAFLLVVVVAGLIADPARVVSKQENLPDGRRGDLKTRVFLDITPNDENNNADAYVDIPETNNYMSLQEFSNMIQIGDVFEYQPDNTYRDGRYSVLWYTQLLEYNSRNIYRIFLEELGDEDVGTSFFSNAEYFYRAQNNRR
jgi:hypothetical protein